MKNKHPRLWLVLVYLVLLTMMIPWYWPAGDTRHAFGFPLWALASLGVVLATSILTAYIYLSSINND